MSETKSISLKGLRTFLKPLMRIINKKAETWDDLKEKPFGSEWEEVKLVDNISVTLTDLYDMGMPIAEIPSLGLVEDETYSIYYDGILYKCQSHFIFDGEAFALGNTNVFPPEVSVSESFGNGEPFLIIDYGNYGEVIGETLDSTHTITISGLQETITKLDGKYLDFDTSNLVKSVNGNTPDDYGDVYLSVNDLYGNLPISKGGTGAATVANARGNLGLGYTSGAVPIANGGTGATTVAAARNALGLGNTSGALPIANGGTGATTVSAARNTLGLGNTSGALPIANGGTGATSAASALTNLGITATAAELNKMDGVTATTAELNYVDGVTSNIQTQLNAKVPTSRKINGKALSADVTLSADDIDLNITNGTGSHSIVVTGYTNATATADYSFSFGNGTKASGRYSHAEGSSTIASGDASHAEGQSSHAEGAGSHAEGGRQSGHGQASLSGFSGEANAVTYTNANASNVEIGQVFTYSGQKAKVVDKTENTVTFDKTLSTTAISNASFVYQFGAYGEISHTEGIDTITQGVGAHAEGRNTITNGFGAHAEGWGSTANGSYSHSEGKGTNAEGEASHAEGRYTKAVGDSSHAEGGSTVASGDCSHAEGSDTLASGYGSHAEGWKTVASGYHSHAEGVYTIASKQGQHAEGKYNIEDTVGTYSHIVGNGRHENTRSNAYTLDWDGNGWFAGTVKVGGTGQDDANAKELATKEYINIRVPAWTSDDEGKFLRIINGTPTWVALPNAEEATF